MDSVIDFPSLENGINEWLNIPSSVRHTLAFLCSYQSKSSEVLASQAQLLSQYSLENKKTEQKLNDLEDKCEGLQNEITRLEKIVESQKVGMMSLQDKNKQQENKIDEITGELEVLRSELENKAGSSEISEIIPILQRLQANKAEKSAVLELVHLCKESEENLRSVKANCTENNQENVVQLNKLKTVQAELKEFHASILLNRPWLEDIGEKVSKNDLLATIQTKVDASDLRKLISEQSNLSTEQVQLKKSAQVLYETVHSKADITAVKNTVTEIRDELLHAIQTLHSNTQNAIDSLKGAIESKATAEEVNKALSTRAGPEDIRTIVDLLDTKADSESIRDFTSRYAKKDEFEVHVQRQTRINNILCSEFSCARWLWKTGKIEKGGSVPWNSEATNTDPNNFLWEKNSTAVVAVSAGLYEIETGFFTSKSAKITLFINDVPVYSRESNSATLLTISAKKALSMSSSSASNVPTHPDGNVLAGVNLHEYLALPGKALVSITFAGEEMTQGFLCLRKL